MTTERETTYDELYLARVIAEQAHKGQVDKAGRPYIEHPVRVCKAIFSWASSDLEAQALALLHDVVEDCGKKKAAKLLKQHEFSAQVLEGLDAITRRHGECWNDYIERIKGNPLARIVKLVDLEDNMTLTRIPELTPKWVARLVKYHRAWRYLNGLSADL